MSEIGDFEYKQCHTITTDHIDVLAKKLLSDESEIVNFYLQPYSTEKNGYLGNHELLTVEIRSRNKPKSKEVFTFFVKTVIESPNYYQKMVFQEESKFFRYVVPRLLENFRSEPWAALCYVATDDLLIMEDLRCQGYKVISEQLTDDQLKSAVACIARFHASSMLLEEKLQKPLNEFPLGCFVEKMFVRDGSSNSRFVSAGVEVIETIASNLNLDSQYASIAYDYMMEVTVPVDGQKSVLCHADLWRNNMMFNKKNKLKCRLVDFQMVVYRSYATDLAQFFYLNATKETRKRLEKNLMELYHATLEKNLLAHGYKGEIISLKTLFNDVQKMRIIGLVMAAQLFPIILLNKQLNEEYSGDVTKLQKHMYGSRKDFVLKAMQLDNNYRYKLEAIVMELIEFVQTYLHNKSLINSLQ